MQYVIKQNQSIYDVALQLYGDASYCVKLLTDNPDLGSLANPDIANITVNYDETIKPTIKPALIVSNEVISDVKPFYLGKQGQSIYDVSIMFGYGIEGVVQFMKDINFNSLRDNIANFPIYVTKINTNLSNFLFLNSKVLSTGVYKINSLQTDDGIDITTDDGLIIEVD